MSKKLAEKAGMIQAPPARVPGAAGNGEAPPRPKTAPGSMMHFMHSQSTAVKENEDLRERVKSFEGALPVRKLDPASIRPSQWANRHADSFVTEEFQALKVEIASASGNVQPIKVRPIVEKGVGPSNTPATTPVAYEIVYGHRRHRACLELGLPVAALVEGVSEQELFVEMERENRLRQDLSAWEQGQMYLKALDTGLYPSQRKLAEAIGRDPGDVGKALGLARLPMPVIEAFPSPLDLQYRWSKPLSDAQQKDPEKLLARAREMKKLASKLSARDVYERLTGHAPVRSSNGSGDIEIAMKGKRVAILSMDNKGRAVVRFEPGTIALERRQDLARLIEDFLGKS